jgi:hypothetical protein
VCHYVDELVLQSTNGTYLKTAEGRPKG